MEAAYMKRKGEYGKREYSSIYPGLFTALPIDVKKFRQTGGKRVKEDDTGIVFKEEEGYIQLQKLFPGLTRKDFSIRIRGNKIFISILSNPSPGAQHKGVQPLVSRSIILPKNVDPDFTSAEYTDGVLTIRLFKTPCPCPHKIKEIFVY